MAKVNLEALNLKESKESEVDELVLKNGQFIELGNVENQKVLQLEQGDSFSMQDGTFYEFDGNETLYEIEPIKSITDEYVRTGVVLSTKEFKQKYYPDIQ